MTRRLSLGFFILVIAAGRAWAEDPAHLSLSLADLTQTAFKSSPKLVASYAEYDASKSQAESAANAELPRLGVDGFARYQTDVPAFSLTPGGPKFTFGDNLNYSLGADLSWTLWDFRSQHQMSDSATAASEAKGQSYRAVRRQLLMALRLSYFQAQINLEQVKLLSDSLKIAQAQYDDIQRQASAGAASRMDLLSAHQEMLDYQRQFRQSQADLSHSLRDLFALTGTGEPADFSLPLDGRLEGKLPKGVTQPTVWLSMDPREDSLKALQGESQVPPDDSIPQLRTYARLARAAKLASEAIHSQLLPRITLNARSDFEYPNGPVLETIQQNTVGVNLSVPLFDWGAIVNDSDAKKKQSDAYLADLDQARTDLKRDWNKAKDLLQSLQFQQELDRTAVSETDELARLSYGSYQAGRLRFLEVESANFRALGAKVQSLRDDLQILMQMSVLSSLSGKE